MTAVGTPGGLAEVRPWTGGPRDGATEHAANAGTTLSVRDLTVWFGHGAERNDAVKDATFSVGAGESFGIVGESGSGKSTVLRAITGLAPTWSGEIALAGQPLGKRRDRAFHRAVQMVFQDPYASLHPRHPVDRVLSETLMLNGIPDANRRVPELLDAVGLGPTFRFRYPHQLSGGQRQRVAIARALAPKPQVLLLDEPTSALDVSVQAEILNLLNDLRAREKLTFVMVSHDLAVIGHMCDRVAVMKQGAIVEVMDVAAMRAGTPQHPYTRQLLLAARGVSRT